MTKDAAKKIKPVDESNLAGYGLSPIAWDRALERLYEFTPKTVFGLATAEPYGATRWRL